MVDRITERDKLAALHAYENARIARRRKAQLDARPAEVDQSALALSGGGIRSATFSLGLMRSLSRLGLLHRFDYLSTVSGGSYIGGFIGGLYARRDGKDGMLIGLAEEAARESRAASDALAAGVARAARAPQEADPLGKQPAVPRSIDWLRNSGNYLAPSGAGDMLYALTLLVRNWFGIQLVIGAALYLVALVAIWLRLLVGSSWLHPALATGSAETLFFNANWLSPFIQIAAVPALLAIAFGWSYWLTRREARSRLSLPLPALGGSLLTIWLAFYICWRSAPFLFSHAAMLPERVLLLKVIGTIGVVGVVAVLTWAYKATARLRDVSDGERSNFQLARAWDLVRQDLTVLQVRMVKLALILLAIGIVDSMAMILWQKLEAFKDVDIGEGTTLVDAIKLSPFAVAVLVPVARWLLKQVGPVNPHSVIDRLKAMGLKAATALIAAVLVLVVTLFWSLVAYAVACRVYAGYLPGLPVGREGLLWLLGVTLLFNLLIGYVAAFLNLSSLSTFYAARLRRAYLGASNRNRFGDEEIGVDMGEANDEIRISDYYGSDAAPLHLINITLNETASEGSNLVQRERHGRNLVLSPAGIITTRGSNDNLQRIHITPADYSHDDEKAALEALDRTFPAAPPGEPIPMAAWVAISGAAFSTGLGAQTNIGMAMLAGLANIRLGYWWNRSRNLPGEAMAEALRSPRILVRDWRHWGNYVAAGWRAFVAHKPWVIQIYLLGEFTGTFHGSDRRRWYLTDGGHFENTAVYELIRRKLPFIVVSDNGEDGARIFDDLANLVRKARVDFGAEIVFEDDTALDAVLGHDPELRRAFRGVPKLAAEDDIKNLAVAMLARIRYQNLETGTLVVVKPRLVGEVPLDVDSYRYKNIVFPQEPTLDQFFDEAQWESYFRLGRLIGERVFAPSATGWHPALLTKHF